MNFHARSLHTCTFGTLCFTKASFLKRYRSTPTKSPLTAKTSRMSHFDGVRQRADYFANSGRTLSAPMNSLWDTAIGLNAFGKKMKISRHGTDAFHGVSSIDLKSPAFEWYEPGSSL